LGAGAAQRGQCLFCTSENLKPQEVVFVAKMNFEHHERRSSPKL